MGNNLLICNKIEPFDLDNERYKEIIKNLMPTWYLENIELTDLDFHRVKKSWNLIKNNDCISIFSSLFYERLFDFHPELRIYFKEDLMIQGHKIYSMIDLFINTMNNESKNINKIMKKIVISHLERKIKANYYRIICDNLIKTLEKILNSEFDNETKLSWEKILSKFLNFLIPLALFEELKFQYGKPGISSK